MSATSSDEAQRLAALYRYDILDTPPDQTLDDITLLASQLCGTPIALISFVDSNRQWFKSKVGLSLAETARDISFCAHAIRGAGEMIVADASLDPRFCGYSLVTGDPHVRFYAGMALVTPDGHALGTLCVIDRRPRELDADQLLALRALRRFVMSELELRRGGKELQRMAAEMAVLNLKHERAVIDRTRQYSDAVASLQDIVKEREEGAKTLRESEARFRMLWETTTDAILLVDRDNRIRYANPAVAEVFGHRPEELIGQSLDILQPEDLREVHRLAFGRYIETGKRTLNWRSTETRGLHRDGHELPIEIAFSTQSIDGEELFAAFVRDITQRKAAEQEIRHLNAHLEQRVAERTQDLAMSNQGLEAFSYSISHDLRAPLRSIDAFAEITLQQYGGDLDNQGKEYLKRISSAALRMGELIDAMLDLARVDRMTLDYVAIDLSGLVHGILSEMVHNEPSRVVQLEIRPGLYIHADAVLLRTVLENLLANAWKFTSKRTDARIEFGLQDGDVYFVRDNGAGFDMRYADKLFKVFERLHGQNEFPGTGVGLTTAQRIVQRHGGKLWADAQIDRGATFYFSLPARLPR